MTAEDEVRELRRVIRDIKVRLARKTAIEGAARTLVDALIKEDTCPHVATQKLIEALDG